ncbi:hypothetical protein GUJ93_ZPchr0002g26116 [Zizania palustris]|uniref:FHA domain-containing protein n=1 Tax=Zizania palustris TaxID=103762 RepID=A0A8J5SG44_ZIZPA|nr:hypothetical protein GUJ93_ZPchr0002g26116 [Zizania palustris]
MAASGSNMTSAGDNYRVGFAKIQGEDFEYFMRTYSIILGRNSKKGKVDLDISILGFTNVSRRHARIFYDFEHQQFSLEVLGKNGCIVQGVLHLPGGGPVKLKSQYLLQIGQKKFYFLLPSQSIFATIAAQRNLSTAAVQHTRTAATAAQHAHTATAAGRDAHTATTASQHAHIASDPLSSSFVRSGNPHLSGFSEHSHGSTYVLDDGKNAETQGKFMKQTGQLGTSNRDCITVEPTVKLGDQHDH